MLTLVWLSAGRIGNGVAERERESSSSSSKFNSVLLAQHGPPQWPYSACSSLASRSPSPTPTFFGRTQLTGCDEACRTPPAIRFVIRSRDPRARTEGDSPGDFAGVGCRRIGEAAVRGAERSGAVPTATGGSGPEHGHRTLRVGGRQRLVLPRLRLVCSPVGRHATAGEFPSSLCTFLALPGRHLQKQCPLPRIVASASWMESLAPRVVIESA